MFAVDLLPGSSLANHTGSWRTETPVYSDFTSPCHRQCRAHESVRAWLTAIPDDIHHAWSNIVLTNPLPATMGYICYASCQDACYRDMLDGPVQIRTIEGYVGKRALDEGWLLPEPAHTTGFRVAVVGSGPCGLSAAHTLRMCGHDVTLIESQRIAGGMLQRSISERRLPKAILQGEITRLALSGIHIATATFVRHIEDLFSSFDGVIWATGASTCMAIVDGQTIWRQPVHTGRRERRTCTLSIGRGHEAGEALSAHMASSSPVHIDPINTSPINTNPVHTNPVHTDPVNTNPVNTNEPPLVDRQSINTWYYRHQSALVPHAASAQLSAAEITQEAYRCMNCGSCFSCDICYSVCPDNAIIKDSAGYRINIAYCKGCGICAEECPSGALEMTPESR